MRQPRVVAAISAAAIVIGATSAGDIWVLAGLLGVLAVLLGSPSGAVAAGLVSASVVVRLGGSDLSGLAGAQAVLGPAAVVGPPTAAASAWAAATGLLLAAPAGWAALPFGVLGAVIVAGPAPRTAADLAVRAGALAIGAAVSALRGRLPTRALWLRLSAAARWGGVAVASAALALALVPSPAMAVGR